MTPGHDKWGGPWDSADRKDLLRFCYACLSDLEIPRRQRRCSQGRRVEDWMCSAAARA